MSRDQQKQLDAMDLSEATQAAQSEQPPAETSPKSAPKQSQSVDEPPPDEEGSGSSSSDQDSEHGQERLGLETRSGWQAAQQQPEHSVSTSSEGLVPFDDTFALTMSAERARVALEQDKAVQRFRRSCPALAGIVDSQIPHFLASFADMSRQDRAATIRINPGLLQYLDVQPSKEVLSGHLEFPEELHLDCEQFMRRLVDMNFHMSPEYTATWSNHVVGNAELWDKQAWKGSDRFFEDIGLPNLTIPHKTELLKARGNSPVAKFASSVLIKIARGGMRGTQLAWVGQQLLKNIAAVHPEIDLSLPMAILDLSSRHSSNEWEQTVNTIRRQVLGPDHSSVGVFDVPDKAAGKRELFSTRQLNKLTAAQKAKQALEKIGHSPHTQGQNQNKNQAKRSNKRQRHSKGNQAGGRGQGSGNQSKKKKKSKQPFQQGTGASNKADQSKNSNDKN